ncbi:MAG: hypothetical protein L3J83_06520 [Proteobacteria bacterium]|nr:hypothetical protein [Pseudomonadota bacterium]
MNSKTTAFIWVLLLIASAIFTLTQIKVETNILKLLPKYDSPITSDLIEAAAQKINDKLIIVVAGNEQETTKQNFVAQITTYSNSGLFKKIDYTVDIKQYQTLYQELLKYRFLMMAQADKQASKDYETSYFIDMATAELYSLTGFNQTQIESDPLFFFNHIIQQLSAYNTLEITADDDLLHIFKDNKHHYIALAQLQHSSFDPSYQQQVVHILNSSQRELNTKHLEFFSFGAIKYAHHAYNQATAEISTVGLGSLIGIILLFLFAFRSLTPLLLSVISIATGIVFALAITLLVFEEVHLFALVFGSTIAGVSIDYCLHYLSEALLNDSQKTIKHIFPSLLIGFLSSAMVYLGFILTGYPVLAQISLFSIAGLFAVLLNVMILFPIIIKYKPSYQPGLILKISQAVQHNPLARLFNSLTKSVIIFSLCLILSWYWLKPNDDVRALQSLSAELKIEESYIRKLLGLKNNRYVLIHAQSIDELLSLEQMVLQQINTQQDDVLIGISDLIPPKETQKQNQAFYQALYSSNNFAEYLNSTGLNISLQNTLVAQTSQIDRIDYHLLQNPAINKLLTQRWFGKVSGQYALAVPINLNINIKQGKQVVVVQQAEDTSRLFGQFRQKSIVIVIVAALMLFMLLALLRYGWRKSAHIVILPFFAGLTSLLLSQMMGLHISLFSVLALLLILGMGLDYMVFLNEAKTKKHRSHVSFALLLSSITTVLSFGLLSLSSVAVIKSFGFTVALGIIIILLISPAIITKKHKRDVFNEKSDKTNT